MATVLEKRNAIGYITIDNPARANVLDTETADQLSQAWKEVWEDPAIRVAIITGRGDRHFCAGHDLKHLAGLSDVEREYLALQRLFWPQAGAVNGARTGVDPRLGDHYPQIWKPVVAAINGWAAGAGFYLTLTSTDIRVACAEHARFKFALLSQGWVGAGPGATYLMRQLRYADAMKILLTDEPVDATEALRVGLVNEVVEHGQLMTRAEEIAQGIAKLPPVAVRMMKEFAIRFREVPVETAWNVQWLMNNLLMLATDDATEGRKAFTEKRAPGFTGGLRRPGEPFPRLSAEQLERIERLRQSGAG